MINRRNKSRRPAALEALEPRRVLAPLLSLEGPSEVVFEGERAAFTLRLSEPVRQAESVFVTTRPGTATLGVDYAAAERLQFNFAPGETSKQFFVSTLAEAVPRREGNETFFVTARPVNPRLSGALTRQVTIGDSVPKPILSIADIRVSEGASGTVPATFTLTLGSTYPRAVSVAYATRDGSATVAGNDYTATSGIVTFAPGETSQTVTVNVTGDRVLEADETFSIVLTNATNATLSRAFATCTIANDETDTAGFQITLNYLTTMQPAWIQSVQRAASKWESIIVGDVPAVTYQGRFIDDFEINVSFNTLGANLLGYARFLQQRPGAGGLPFLGEMVMNSLYANQPGIYDTIVHELAHALGFTPGMWGQIGMAGGSLADPRFLGANAVREFNTIFGTSVTGVPLYEQGAPGDGSYGAHWRDSVFGNEAMVSAGDPRVTGIPVSRVTVAHFADLGYQVSYAAADPYTPPTPRTLLPATPTGTANAAWVALASTNRPLVHVTSRPTIVTTPAPTGSGSSRPSPRPPAVTKQQIVTQPAPIQTARQVASRTTRPPTSKPTVIMMNLPNLKLDTQGI
jgi:hypothetical protein